MLHQGVVSFNASVAEVRVRVKVARDATMVALPNFLDHPNEAVEFVRHLPTRDPQVDAVPSHADMATCALCRSLCRSLRRW